MKNRTVSIHEFVEGLWSIGRALSVARPTIATIINSAAYILHEVNSAADEANDTKALSKHLMTSSYELIREYQLAVENATKSASGIFKDGDKVLTHSYSNTVKNALLRSEKRLEIFCTESRPLFEGRRLAEELASSGMDCTVISDAAVAHHISDIDLAVVGADTILNNGSIVNKIGTRMIAIISKYERKPFYVASDTWKVLPQKLTRFLVEEESDTDEIINPGMGVHGRNVSFDMTDPELISHIVTEFGLIQPSQISRYIKEFDSIPKKLLSPDSRSR